MILDSKFHQLANQNFLRSSREYELAKYFWSNAERAMQQKPTQQSTLTTKNLTEKEQTYVTDGLAEFFAGFSWVKPEAKLGVKPEQMPAYNHQSNSVPNEHCFTRSELQSIQANNRKLIKVIQEDIEYDYSFLFSFKKATQKLKDTNVLKVRGKEHFDAYYDSYVERIRELNNKISSNKLKLKKLVALQTKIKRML